MKKALKKILIFVFILLTLDAGLGFLIERGYHRVKRHDTGFVGRAIEAGADVYVLGDSRARRHYVSKILAAKLGAKVYNAGSDGQSMLYYAAVGKTLIDEASPKMLILSLDPHDFMGLEQAYQRLSVLLPYHQYPHVRKALVRRSRFERWKMKSVIYPYNSLILQIARSALTRAFGSYRDWALGYEPHTGSRMKRLLDAGPKKTPYDVSEKKIRYEEAVFWREFQELYEYAKAKNVQLIVGSPPVYQRDGFGNEPEAIALMERLEERCRAMRIPFIEVSCETDRVFLSEKLYYDVFHMNFRGANLFSHRFAKRLAPYLRA